LPRSPAREREILALLAEGLGDAEIAERLSISDKTVRNHVSNVFDKLGVWTRARRLSSHAIAGLPASRRRVVELDPGAGPTAGSGIVSPLLQTARLGYSLPKCAKCRLRRWSSWARAVRLEETPAPE
jgi:DNA-binding CsgD family transcriptional regulator